jgi:quercetin dioxygenase-like cupin family protein
MVAIIDLTAEFGKLSMLQRRRPDMLEEERKASGAFATLAPYRDGNIFSAKFAGDGAWERHPNGDELVYILDGATMLCSMDEDGLRAHVLRAGMVAIVPQGLWHRFESPGGVVLVSATPQPTDHPEVDIDDPRLPGQGNTAA